MLTNFPSLKEFQERIANISIGPTTLRNQGASGVAKAARLFLKDLDLAKFGGCEDEAEFNKEILNATNNLRRAFPQKAQNWGTARKAINLFLAEAFYHKILCEGYKLTRIENYLEVPLDSQVGVFLRKEAKVLGKELPLWPGLKKLTPVQSKCYQDFARDYALQKYNWARVYLDVVIWKPSGMLVVSRMNR